MDKKDLDYFKHRVDMFEDSEEIVNQLNSNGHATKGADAYWWKEAAVHIEGQQALIQELLNALRKNLG